MINVRFPVVSGENMVVGVVSMLNVVGKENRLDIESIVSRNLIMAKPQASLANISQKIILEDLNMLPVVAKDPTLLGVTTRRQAVEDLPNLQHPDLYIHSGQILSNLQYEDGVYEFVAEPTMIDNAGNFAQGVLIELIKDISARVSTEKHWRSIIIEQLMLYFVRAVQINDCLVIRPCAIIKKRCSPVIDFEILLEEQIAAKALVTTEIN